MNQTADNSDRYHSPEDQDYESKPTGLTVTGGALSIISTVVGAGIVSLPYVLKTAGYFLGFGLHIFMITCLTFSVHLLLKARENLNLG
jgi:amino acid permease